MNWNSWVPEYLQPFDFTIGLMIIVWWLAATLALHRITRYWILSRRFSQCHEGLGMFSSQIAKKKLPTAAEYPQPMMSNFVELARTGPTDAKLLKFVGKWLTPDQLIDSRNDRFIDLLKVVAPMLGLAGTVAGVMGAFAALGLSQGLSPQALGDPIKLALRSTLLGILCATFCYIVRAAAPLHDLHRRAREEISLTWHATRPSIRPKRKTNVEAVTAAPLNPDSKELDRLHYQQPKVTEYVPPVLPELRGD